MDNKKYIYIILSQTGTKISRTIKFFTHAPYNHASISSDKELSEMYSFSRFHINRPLPAGFFSENRFKGVFSVYNFIPCEIYRIEVTDKQYNDYSKLIDHFRKNTKLYSYNLLGLITIPFGIPLRRRTRFVCSQFVAYALTKCKIAKFNKDFSLITPEDFRHIENSELIYCGDIKCFDPIKSALA